MSFVIVIALVILNVVIYYGTVLLATGLLFKKSDNFFFKTLGGVGFAYTIVFLISLALALVKAA